MSYINLCDPKFINTAIDACAFVKANCGDQTDYLNFIDFYYCDLHQSTPLVVLIIIASIAFVFNFLGTTADTYLGPTLETITEKLKLSEAVAGVTLLALANGATDVIAGLVAGGKSSGGVTIAIGGLFGACLFTVTCVLARCIAGGNNIRVDAKGLKRDIFFMLLATLYFVGLTIYKEITWYLALGFFVIYVVFIGYVIYIERVKAKAKVTMHSKLDRVRAKLLHKKGQGESESEAGARADFLWKQVLGPYLLKSILNRKKSKGLKRNLSKSLSNTEFADGNIVDDLEKVKEEVNKSMEEEDEIDDSFFGKVMRVYNAPLFFVRNLTIPPFEADNWNVYYACCSPIFGTMFLLWQTGLLKFFFQYWYLWIVYGVVAVAMSAFVYFAGRNKNLAEHYGGTLATIAFVMSALWLNLIAACFMDMLSLITIISGLPLNFLSLTLLAWGNSLDDFFIDYVIAKSGHGAMAVAGVYGGQLFNLLIGFGGAMMIQSVRSTVHIDIYNFGGDQAKENLLTVVLLSALIIGLMFTLVVGKMKQYVLGKNMMYFLVIYYTVFLIAVTTITLAWKAQ